MDEALRFAAAAVAISASSILGWMAWTARDRAAKSIEQVRLARNDLDAMVRKALAESSDTLQQMGGETASTRELPDGSLFNAEIDRLRSRVVELESTVPFEREASQAKLSSAAFFVSGLAVIGMVVVAGIIERSDNQGLTTGDGIVRASVIGAAFYAAGQLFRRSSTLHIRGQEFERAAIAMKWAHRLSDELADEVEADAMLRAVYESHLRARSADAEADGTALDVAEVVNSINRLRGH